ncbi:SMI1 / KNR4 family protein [compost metagenome]
MTVKEQLQSLSSKSYIAEDGESYQIELLPPYTDEEIEKLKNQLPNNNLPEEIHQLLLYARGFKFGPLEKITFDTVNTFGFEDFFPNTIQLSGDGFGNFWILDLDENGKWGHVFYVCHDPAVVIKHSENLKEFILHIDEFGEKGKQSHLDQVHEKSVFDIWERNYGLIPREAMLQSHDEDIIRFATLFPENYLFADLQNKSNNSGFAWGKLGSDVYHIKRHESKLIWAFEKLNKKKGFFARLFSK